ncbi:hypothetical protein GR250_04490 [Rhizobium leguminosarum]|nr:hypothetical protein [Rhizobium leguminosarum]
MTKPKRKRFTSNVPVHLRVQRKEQYLRDVLNGIESPIDPASFASVTTFGEVHIPAKGLIRIPRPNDLITTHSIWGDQRLVSYPEFCCPFITPNGHRRFMHVLAIQRRVPWRCRGNKDPDVKVIELVGCYIDDQVIHPTTTRVWHRPYDRICNEMAPNHGETDDGLKGWRHHRTRLQGMTRD